MEKWGGWKLRISVIFLVVGVVLVVLGTSATTLQTAGSSPQYMPQVESFSPGGSSSNPVILTSSTFTASVELLQEYIYGNTATQSDVVIGQVIVTGVDVVVDSQTYTTTYTTSQSQWGTQYWYNASIALPTNTFSGPITYEVTYYDNMYSTGTTSTAVADYDGYIELNPTQPPPTINSEWYVNGNLIDTVINGVQTTYINTLNITTPNINVYGLITSGSSYVSAVWIKVMPTNGTWQKDITLNLLSNGSWYANYTFPGDGSYYVIGYVNTTSGGLQALQLFSSTGTPTASIAPNLTSFNNYLFLGIGVVLVLVGIVLWRYGR